MISVVIPIFNVETCLRQCVDSVIAQTYRDLQIILVDDGSTDSSGQICDEYAAKDARIEVIHKENGGLSDARNAGTEMAKGEYIYYLDGDDWLDNNALKTMVNLSLNDNCDIVVARHFYAFPDKSIPSLSRSHLPVSLTREEAIKELVLNSSVKSFAWGKLYHLSIVKNIPFIKGKYFEDSFWQHLVFHQANVVGVLDKPLYYYRQRQDSISGSLSSNIMDLLDGLYERFLFIKVQYPQYSSLMAKSLWKAMWNVYTINLKSTNQTISENFNVFKSRILQTNKHDFDRLIMWDYHYIILSRHLWATKIVYFVERLINFIF